VRKIYVASSWRNPIQPAVVEFLRMVGHEVYDFRNPAPGNHGFAWSAIDPAWEGWTPERFRELLSHPTARAGFALDRDALDWCDTCVLVLPCGRSAHLEAGYACGQGKRVIFMLSQDGFEPELMYRLGDALVCGYAELQAALE
jgi:nucleoside 2-deoxyribosyltransferase